MKPLSLVIILIAALTTTANAASPPTGYQPVPEPTTPPNPSRVQVIDFFWYGCPYCNLFEPAIENWLDSKPDNVDFIRVPAITRQGWTYYARTFFTAEALGVLDRLHRQLYTAIHPEGRELDKMDELAEFFAEHGIDRSRFEEAFNSDEVNQKVKEAGRLTRRYGIESVPAVVVNGKYRTNPELAGGASRILDVVNKLIAIEQKDDTTP
jgi:thiol:disulfide interchange protein DsbA